MASQWSYKHAGKYLGMVTRFYATVGLINEFTVQCPLPWFFRSIKNDVYCFDCFDYYCRLGNFWVWWWEGFML